ncbi:DNA polymerase beta domain protein region [Ignisphaera aggregans DSM 17230]|uniref:DNA polymerase beta domain protein region n=1 Tax=Ignisphaera aggregans (strain DSM 17230 / JCM 13409 / AQ1.S1) TaxID=583356 RepID=E0SNK0_IGNAA|nr:DNA polymerase beta domain protein region [Ignisphaera aggregans DSM 17230]
MGEKTFEKSWARVVEEVVRRISAKFPQIEAVVVFGSWSRGRGGEWSDIDILIVVDEAEKYGVLERFAIATELGVRGTDIFIYSYREVESMAKKGNPLVLSALIEGIKIISSERIERLSRDIAKLYTRTRRMWKRLDSP